jgi:DNA end-binding protein Ku
MAVKKTATKKAPEKAQAPQPVAVETAAQGSAAAHKAWTGMMTFGLVSFPVTMFTASREEKVEFNQVHAVCEQPLKQKQELHCPNCQVDVPKDEALKGHPLTTKGPWVVVDKADMERCKPESAKVMEISEFVPDSQVDPIYFESSFYLAPGEGGNKAFALIRAGMVKQGVVGIAKVVKSSREHIVVVRPYGIHCSSRTKSGA